jgi:hypothetical protein
MPCAIEAETEACSATKHVQPHVVSKTIVYERMASQRQRSWFATPVDFLQLSLETTLSLIVRLDEFWENAMLVVYERVHLRKEAHLAIKIRGHIAIKVTAI